MEEDFIQRQEIIRIISSHHPSIHITSLIPLSLHALGFLYRDLPNAPENLNSFMMKIQARAEATHSLNPFTQPTAFEMRRMLREKLQFEGNFSLSSTELNNLNVDELKQWLSIPQKLATFKPLVKLHDYQTDVAKFISSPYTKSIIVIHGTGTGKTLTAINACVEIMKGNSNISSVIISTPVVPTFRSDLSKYGLNRYDSRFNIITHHKFLQQSDDTITRVCKDKILVVDEVHKVKKISGKIAERMILCSKQAAKIILMTATPIINKLDDLANMLTMSTGTRVNPNDVSSKLVELEINDDRLFSYYERDPGDPNYPLVKEHPIGVKMNDNESSIYDEYVKRNLANINEAEGYITQYVTSEVENKQQDFFLAQQNELRRASDIGHLFDSPKIKWIVKRLVNEKRRTLIHSFWIEACLKRIAQVIDKVIGKGLVDPRAFRYDMITGSVTQDNRNRIVNEFNEGELNIVLFSSAGGEGLSFHGVQDVIIVEGAWNYSTVHQAISRAVRLGSHLHLPSEERIVDVYYLILESSLGTRTIDENLWLNYINPKRELADDIMEHIAALSI